MHMRGGYAGVDWLALNQAENRQSLSGVVHSRHPALMALHPPRAHALRQYVPDPVIRVDTQHTVRLARSLQHPQRRA